MDKDTTTMRLHEFLRGDLRSMDAILDAMEQQIRQMRALLSTTRLIADDLQVIEEGDVAPGPDGEARS
jgi:hypothetical protein